MSSCLELDTWRIAASYYGLRDGEPIFEDYEAGNVTVRVYLIPESWIQRQGLPPRFFENMSIVSGVVGCIKTSLCHNGKFIPCIMYDVRSLQGEWHNFDPSMDPVLYIITDLQGQDPEQIVIYQAINNPLHIGLVRNCSKDDGWPKVWDSDDIGRIYGIAENDEESKSV